MRLVDEHTMDSPQQQQHAAGAGAVVAGGRLLKIELPAYDLPPPWRPPTERLYHPNYNNDIRQFLPRSVKLRRSKVTDALGFNVRGGKEYLCGIYISKVSVNTEAERLGLQEGDQILFVNGVSFDDIEHSKAVKALKSHTDVEMTVKYFPYGYNKTYDKSRALASLQSQQQQQSDGGQYGRELTRTPTAALATGAVAGHVVDSGHLQGNYQGYNDLVPASSWYQQPPQPGVGAHQMALSPHHDHNHHQHTHGHTGEEFTQQQQQFHQPSSYYERQMSYSAPQPPISQQQHAQYDEHANRIQQQQQQQLRATPNKYV